MIKIVATSIFLLTVYSLSGQVKADTLKFLFLGHTYDWANSAGNTVDPRVEMIDKSVYDGFWLGGDICANTTLDPKTMVYLDGLFQLKNPYTHFVLGNHDVRDNNLDFYFQSTGRADYYTSTHHNMVLSVLNTNLNSSDCENLNAQYRMLESVIDTIQDASHYVLLMHHQIFTDIPGLENFKSNGVCQYYAMNCDSSQSYFSTTIYPKLVQLEQKGIDIIIVVGDTGWDKGAEDMSADGISFLASGINNSYYKTKALDQLPNVKRDKLLEFQLIPKERTLTWTFRELNGMIDLSLKGWMEN